MQSFKSLLKKVYVDDAKLASFIIMVGFVWYFEYSTKRFYDLAAVAVLPLLIYIVNRVIFSNLYAYFYPPSKFITTWVSYVDGNGKEHILVSVMDNPVLNGMTFDDVKDDTAEYIRTGHSQEENRGGVRGVIKQGTLLRVNHYQLKLFSNWNPLRLFSSITLTPKYYLGNNPDTNYAFNVSAKDIPVDINTEDFLRLRGIQKEEFYDLNDITMRCAALKINDMIKNIQINENVKEK